MINENAECRNINPVPFLPGTVDTKTPLAKLSEADRAGIYADLAKRVKNIF